MMSKCLKITIDNNEEGYALIVKLFGTTRWETEGDGTFKLLTETGHTITIEDDTK